MRTCENCGTVVTDTAKFCRKCGSKLPEIIMQDTPAEDGYTQGMGFEDETIYIPQEDAEEMIASADPAEDPYLQALQGEEPEMSTQPAWEHIEEPTMAQEAEEEPEPEAPEPPRHQYVAIGAAADQPKKQAPVNEAKIKGTRGRVEPKQAHESQTRIHEEQENKAQERTVNKTSSPDWNHTAEFDPKDISENKVLAMLVYLLGPIGIIIALLGSNTSPYAGFHVRQGLKFVVLDSLIVIFSILLSFTIIVPLAGIVLYIVLEIVKVICFFSICKGQAKEPPVVRSFKFLR